MLILNRPAEALTRFEREMQISPRNPEVFRRAGLVAARRVGDPARAVRYLEQYLVLAPDGPRAEEVRGELAAIRARRGLDR